MDSKSFRILLDLSELSVISFKYIWMNISPRDLKTIGDLKLGILKKLGLDRDDIKLFVNDGLLLEEEKIVVLRENDTVKVQYEGESLSTSLFNLSCSAPLGKRISDLEKHFENLNEISVAAVQPKKKRKSSKKDCNITPEKDPVPKKRKRESTEVNEVVTDLNNASKSRKKKKMKEKSFSELRTSEGHQTAVSSDCSEITTKSDVTFSLTTDNQTNSEIAKVKSKKKQRNLLNQSSQETLTEFCYDNEERAMSFVSSNNSSLLENVDGNNLTVVTNNQISPVLSLPVDQSTSSQGNNCKKKKRKNRKRKNKTNLIVPLAPSINGSETKNTVCFDPCDAFSSVRKHIRFVSPTPDFHNEKHVEVVDVDSYVVRHKPNSSSETADCSPSKSGKSPLSSESPKISTPYPVSGEYKSWTVSPMLSDYSFGTPAQSSLTRTAMDDTRDMLPTFEMEQQQKKNSTRLSYKDYPVLNVFPAVGSCIAYKVLELDESYSPVVSDFKEGTVVAFDPETQAIEIELKEAEIKPGRIGKFEMHDEEIPPDEVIKKVTVEWSSLIDPRLIESSQISESTP